MRPQRSNETRSIVRGNEEDHATFAREIQRIEPQEIANPSRLFSHVNRIFVEFDSDARPQRDFVTDGRDSPSCRIVCDTNRRTARERESDQIRDR